MNHTPRTGPHHSVALPVRRLDAPLTTGGATVVLRRDGLGYQAMAHGVCPACRARDGNTPANHVLRKSRAWTDALEMVLNPITASAGGLALLAADVRDAGALVFFFGPTLTMAWSSLHRLLTGKRFRLKVFLCAACQTDLRAETARQARGVTLARNGSAFLLMMMAPLALQLQGATQTAVYGLVASVLAGISGVAWGMDRRASRAFQQRLPRLLSVSADGATLELPATWPALTAGGEAAMDHSR